MRSKFIILGLATISLLVIGAAINRGTSTGLINPSMVWNNTTPSTATPTPTPTPTPVTFQFNSSTDLKQELDLVNPKVQESDFESLKKLLPSL